MQVVPRYTNVLLVLIVCFAFVTRLYNLHLPETYIFDEVYHAVTAKLIARDDPRAYEWWNPPVEPNTAVDWLHPPLAKYTQAVSLLAFGENSFGWRFSSAMFGVLVIVAVYALATELFQKPSIGLLSAWLASLDGLLLVQSRVAMNDIHVTFFILLTLWCYVRFIKANLHDGKWQPVHYFWLVLTGLAAGLAIGTKWSGVFALAIIWLSQLGLSLWVWFKSSMEFKKSWIKSGILMVVFWFAVPALMYVASYGHMFAQGKDLSHFRELHRQIWWYQTNLTATHGYQSRPWQWFLDLRPVWYYVDYVSEQQIANIYAFGNPFLFWAGDVAVLLSITIIIILVFTHQLKWTRFEVHQLGFLLLGYFLVWTPWLFSPRIMFFYHYTPAVPLLCILLAYWVYYLWQQKNSLQLNKVVVISTLFLIFTGFVVFYPQWTGIPVDTDWANQVYFAVRSWK